MPPIQVHPVACLDHTHLVQVQDQPLLWLDLAAHGTVHLLHRCLTQASRLHIGLSILCLATTPQVHAARFGSEGGVVLLGRGDRVLGHLRAVPEATAAWRSIVRCAARQHHVRQHIVHPHLTTASPRLECP